MAKKEFESVGLFWVSRVWANIFLFWPKFGQDVYWLSKLIPILFWKVFIFLLAFGKWYYWYNTIIIMIMDSCHNFKQFCSKVYNECIGSRIGLTLFFTGHSFYMTLKWRYQNNNHDNWEYSQKTARHPTKLDELGHRWCFAFRSLIFVFILVMLVTCHACSVI